MGEVQKNSLRVYGILGRRWFRKWNKISQIVLDRRKK